VYDFLKTDLRFEFIKRPSLLREELLSQSDTALKEPIILDEVQKVPQILDEVHWLIENKGLSFIMCGSSARKLKKSHANLLGGRAWRFELFPFTSHEIGTVDLLRCLNHGMIPVHYLQNNYKRSLKGYVNDYLKEEVFDEALTRDVPAFSRFFEAVGYTHGQLVNYSNIARDCGVTAKTVKEYYNILVDTLVGILIKPFKKREGRQIIIKAPRFYFFDVGTAGILTQREILETRGELFGRAFEHFILMELLAHRSYTEKDYPIRFWRTKSGLEVDFVLGDGDIAVEVKGTERAGSKDLTGLNAFIEEYSPEKAITVSCERAKRVSGKIDIIPWRLFLDELWSGHII
jgi:predicted AAA+ superfamily ATPase